MGLCVTKIRLIQSYIIHYAYIFLNDWNESRYQRNNSLTIKVFKEYISLISNILIITEYQVTPMDDEICCPQFNPVPWDDITTEWSDKKFIKDKVLTLFFMPLNFGSVMRRLDARMTASGASSPDNMNLSDHISKWRTDLYVSVDKDVDGVQNGVLSGRFYSKVYEGPFKDAGRWMEDFSALLVEKGLDAEKVYSWYTTCPKCAKEHGRNYVVLFAKLA